jgi:uncharacterized protein with von Willebrand factor type A (vWA) domain
MRGVPHELSARCHIIANLTAKDVSARDELRKAIRKYVGDPVSSITQKAGAGPTDSVLAVDVSGSMLDDLSQARLY